MWENGSMSADIQRTSSTAFIGRDDPVVHCVLSRAAELQGYHEFDLMENLQITAYAESQQYMPHYDWFAENLIPSMNYQNRISTIFAVLDSDCENCGTMFPRLAVDWSKKDPKWCDFVECQDTERLTVKAVPGSAVFWKNLRDDHWGDPRTLHAGLPVPKGSKVGVNIWSRAWAPGPV
jgi:prolyl 4-hydroxylase